MEENNFLLNESANLDYERIKNQYPLRENASSVSVNNRVGGGTGNLDNLNAHDISAVLLQDDSVMQEKNLLGDQSADYTGAGTRQQNRVLIQ